MSPPNSPGAASRGAAGHTDAVTLLTTKGPLATKVFTWSPAANAPQIADYGLAKLFRVDEMGVSSIHDLAAGLESIAGDSRTFVVRGRPIPGIDSENAVRRHHTRKKADGSVEHATLEAVPRYWIPLDCDSIPCPDHIDPIRDDDKAIKHVVSLLPPEFGSVTVYYQFTSSHGIKPGIRARLYYWADKPMYDEQLKSWLADAPVDHSIFTPSQPIYTARPIFIGMSDPVRCRSGLIQGERNAVTPPVLPIGEPDLLANIANTTATETRAKTKVDSVPMTKRSRVMGPSQGDLFEGMAAAFSKSPRGMQ